MPNVTRSQLQPYGIAILCVATALLLTLLLKPLLAPSFFILFFPAVMVSALYGGMKPGIFASIVSALACKYFLLAPVNSLSIPNPSTAGRLVLFLLVTGLITIICSALRRARERTEVTLLRLRESEERYRVLAETVPQLVWITRPDGFADYYNQRWIDYTGLKLEETLGWDWQQVIHPDEVESTLQRWRTALATGNPFEMQYRLRHGDGLYRWHIGRAIPLRDSNGEIVNWFGTCTDIHDQKQIEAALHQREQQFRTLSENSPNIIARIDKDLRHAYVNPAIERATGISAEAFIGKTYAELGFPDEICTCWQQKLQEIFAGGQARFVEFDFPAPDGMRYYQSRLVPEFGLDGSVESVLGIGHDVTDYKRAEQALRQSEARFRRLVESNVIGCIFWDVSGGITDANDAFLQMVGYTRDDLREGKVRWKDMTPVEQLYLSDRAIAQMKQFGTTAPLEKEYICKDGSRVPVLLGGVMFEGSQEQGVSFVLDLSNRRQVEQERMQLLEQLESKQKLLEAVLQQIPAGLMVAEAPSGKLVLRNEQVQKILRGSFPTVDQMEDYLPEPFQAFYPDGKPYMPQELPLARSLLSGEVVREEEISVVCGDGSQRMLLIDSSPIQNGEGQTIAAVITFYDITERKRSHEQIQLYADVVKNVQVGIVVWQLEDLEDSGSFRLMTCNPAAYEVTGVDFEALIGTTMRESFPSLTRSQLTSVYLEVVRTGQARDLGEVCYGDERIAEGVFSLKVFPLPNRCLGLAFENISDRKKVEEALWNAHQRLNFHVENTPLAVIERDRNFRITRWSPAAERIFGWKAEEIIGKGPDEWHSVFAEDLEMVNAARNRLLNGIEQQNIIRNRSYRKDGSVVHCEWYNSALLDESGQFVSVLALALDVTERKRAEEALQNSQERLKLAQKVGKIGAWEWNLQTQELIWTEELETLYGLAPGSFGGKYEHWVEAIHPSDRARVEREAMRTVTEGVEFDTEFRILWSDGSLHWIAAKAQVFNDDTGTAERIIGVNMDITERKQAEEALRRSEERFRIAQELSLDAFIILQSIRDAGGEIVDFQWEYVNPKAAEIIRRAPEDLIGQRLLQVLPGNKTDSELFDRYVRVVKTGIPHDIEIFYHSEGITGWFRNMAVKLNDGIAISFGDITKRKEAEVERANLLEREKAARTQAEAANRIKDEFLAILSHELRSPLNPIMGWARLLQTRQFDEATRARGLEIIERNAKLQIQLIEDLLDVSRILRGKLSLNICPVNLVSTIEAALETVRLAASTKSIEIKTVYEPDVGQALGDSGRLQQVVWNLLSNAVKFTPNGGRIEVRLSGVRSQESGVRGQESGVRSQELEVRSQESGVGDNYAQIQVCDTGKGINPEFLPYVFDYFRQENSSTTRMFGGLGLGLAIVRYLVEQHGGRVCAESRGEGQGATFTVWLPRMPTPAETTPETQHSDDSPDLSGIRVLVVDDEEDMREFLAFVLEDYGAQVTVAASAGEALAALPQVKPDILLSDIGMPEVDGYMLIRQIRALPGEQGGKIPAIALTAYAGEADQTKALSAGFTQHVAKPVEVVELASVVASLARSNRSR